MTASCPLVMSIKQVRNYRFHTADLPPIYSWLFITSAIGSRKALRVSADGEDLLCYYGDCVQHGNTTLGDTSILTT